MGGRKHRSVPCQVSSALRNCGGNDFLQVMLPSERTNFNNSPGCGHAAPACWPHLRVLGRAVTLSLIERSDPAPGATVMKRVGVLCRLVPILANPAPGADPPTGERTGIWPGNRSRRRKVRELAQGVEDRS